MVGRARWYQGCFHWVGGGEGSFTLEMSSMTSEICFGNVQKFKINIEIWKLEIRSKRNLISFAAPAILCTIETCKN